MVLVGTVILSSCKSATERYIDGFEAFVVRTERNADNYNTEQWDKADMQFDNYTGERYEKVEQKLTPEQKKKVGELTARYYKLRVKSAGGDIIEKIKGGLNYIEGFAEEIMGGISDNENENEK